MERFFEAEFWGLCKDFFIFSTQILRGNYIQRIGGLCGMNNDWNVNISANTMNHHRLSQKNSSGFPVSTSHDTFPRKKVKKEATKRLSPLLQARKLLKFLQKNNSMMWAECEHASLMITVPTKKQKNRGQRRAGGQKREGAREREPQWPLSHKLPGTTQSPEAWHMHTALSVCPFRRQTSWDEPDKPACDSTRKRINRRECTISDTARQSQGQGKRGRASTWVLIMLCKMTQRVQATSGVIYEWRRRTTQTH